MQSEVLGVVGAPGGKSGCWHVFGSVCERKMIFEGWGDGIPRAILTDL